MTHLPSASPQSRPSQSGQATKNRRGPQTPEQTKQPASPGQAGQAGQAGQRAATAREHKARAKQATPPKSTSRPSERRVRIGSPTALLAVVPLLLGFEPGNSMVVIGTEPPRAEVRVTLRYNLPDPPDGRLAAEIVRHAVGVLAAQHIESAVAVGYGPEYLVSPLAEALRDHSPQAGIAVTELLRAEQFRYWSYICAEPGCCPPEGTPFDVRDHPAALAMMAASAEATVLASRDELVASLAPAGGEAGAAMHRATRRAEEQVARLLARIARSSRKGSGRRLIATSGLQAVTDAIKLYRGGDRIGTEQAAWLTVVLRDMRVRDDAWSRMDPDKVTAHLRLWTDLTLMARPGYVAAPASLLAFVAWQAGNGALANVALDRALTDIPQYSMALLLRQAIDSGAPPSLARLPMTPEEVAASYDELEADEDDDDALELNESDDPVGDERAGRTGEDDSVPQPGTPNG